MSEQQREAEAFEEAWAVWHNTHGRAPTAREAYLAGWDAALDWAQAAAAHSSDCAHMAKLSGVSCACGAARAIPAAAVEGEAK